MEVRQSQMKTGVGDAAETQRKVYYGRAVVFVNANHLQAMSCLRQNGICGGLGGYAPSSREVC